MQVTLFPDMIKCKRQGEDGQKNLSLKYRDSDAEEVPFLLSRCAAQ